MIQPIYEKKVTPSMLPQKQLSADFEVKSLDEDGYFAGYASVFDVVDNQRDIVLRGAFRESIRRRVDQIKLLWQHDMTQPIGYFTVMFEDENGLYVEGKLMLEVARAREAYALLKKGVVQGLSIGYSPTRYHMDPDSGVRKLSKLELVEVSLVTFPANHAAQVTVVKGENEKVLKRVQDDMMDAREIAALCHALERLEQLVIGL